MKKILLSFLALIAMVGMVNAQRAWAYDLQLTSAESSYTFAFKAMTAGTATLVFTDAVGAEVGTVDLGAVEAGANTKTLDLAEIPGTDNLNWAVKMTGAAIEEVTEVTAAEDKYYYYLAQDVAANTNPESKHFGKMYVLETYKGKGDGASAHSQTQTPGIYVYDPMLNLENYAEGYLPSNVTLNTAAAGKGYRELHRMAINPVKDELAFVQSAAVKVWAASLDNLETEATNVVDGTGIAASSLCYDENGTLYVLDPFAATATIYKQVDGEFVKFVERDNWGWTSGDRNAMESDGRGGLWVVQNIADLATNSHSEDMLTHINAEGEVDFFVNKTSSEELQALMPAASNRGQIGYDAKHDVLALGGKGSVKLFNVTYTEDGPTLSLWQTVTLGGDNVDGLAFDYAGDLIAMSASVERFYKFALPTDNNTCTIPAPKAQVVVKEVPTPTYTVTVSAENGSVGGLENEGVYEKDASVTLTATAADGYEFVNWTVGGEEVSTENSYTFVVSADVTVVANFKKAVEEHTITLSGFLKYSNEYRGHTTLQNEEGDTAFFVYNYVDGVPAYGEDYTVTANLGELTLEGTGSWKLIDELETITAVLYNEEGTAVYNVTVSAKAPEVHNLACTDALYVENISEYMSELIITGVIDEDTLQITVSDWQEATAGTYDQVMGALNDEVYFQPESAVVTIVDTKLTIVFSAKDELGNTYNVNVTATPKPNTPLVVENATFTVDGDNLTIQGQWETKSVVVTLGGWSTTKYGEYNAVLMTGTGEADDDIYAEFSAVLSKDGTTATLTGVAANWDGTKYDVTISGLAPAETPTALDNVDTTVAPVKAIVNGQLVILKDGVKYNAQGAVVK